MEPGPKLIDRTYRVHARLGEGGMGAVYSASHRLTGRMVALKLLLAGGAAEPSEGSRLGPRLALTREFQTLASLHHPNVIEVTDYGFDPDSGPYVAMELLDRAQTLVEAAAGEPFQTKIEMLAHMLRALSYLHLRGVIHRDLKPNNVLCSGGSLKVVDFGLAVTGQFRAQELAGTGLYIAPEIFRGDPPSVQSDLYSVGIIIRQLMGDDLSVAETLDLRPAKGGRGGRGGAGEEGREELNVPGAERLHEVLGRLLARNPKERYSSASEVLQALTRVTGRSLPVETSATRESFLSVPELVGRDKELQRLTDALQSAAKGQGSTWLVAGESGVGKSRLISELRTLALVHGGSVCSGQAVAEGGRSFQLWSQVLRTLCLRVDPQDAEASVLKPLVPELPTLLGRVVPDAPLLAQHDALNRLFGAVAGVLQMRDRLTVILLEDLHWADVDSLRVLAHLSSLSANMPLLVIGSYRFDEAPDLAARIPDATLLRLLPLAKEDCRVLAASMAESLRDEPGVVDYLYRESEGNVFFVIEIIRELASRAGRLDLIGQVQRPERVITGGIARVIRRRLEQVPKEDRPLLTLAAIMGREVDFAVLRELACDIDLSAWLLRSANSGILERQAEQWRFSHDKLREAILADAVPAERPSSHRKVARAIEAAYSGAARDAKSAVLAYHFEQSGDAAEASDYCVQAGASATRLCAYEEARHLYATALRLAASLPSTDATRRNQIDTLLRIAYTRFISDSAEQNLPRMTRARALLDEIGDEKALGREDTLRLARIESVIGRIHFYRGDIAQAIAHYWRVLPIAEASGDAELAALPSLLIGTALLTQGNPLQAEPLLAKAVEPLDRLGEPFEWFRAAGYHGSALIGMGRYVEGVARLNSVVERGKKIGQPSILSASYLMRGSAYLLSGDWHIVIENLTKAIDLAGETGDRLIAAMAWSGIGWAKSHLGSINAARSCRNKGLDIARELGGHVMLEDWYQAGDAEMALHAGDFDQALSLAESLGRQSEPAKRLLSLGIAERVQSEVLARYARFEEADEHMRKSVSVLEEGGLVLQAGWSRAHWAAQFRARGMSDEAARLFQEALAPFERSGCEVPLEAIRRLQEQGI